MIFTNLHNHIIQILVTVILLVTLTACTTQNWYKGAQSAQTAQCMKEPLSEFEDCNEQTKESYDSFKENREQLIDESTAQ